VLRSEFEDSIQNVLIIRNGIKLNTLGRAYLLVRFTYWIVMEGGRS
jgi:hypothetical protein